MSFTEAEFAEHSAHESLRALGKTIRSATTWARERNDEHKVDHFDRFNEIRLFTYRRLKAADPILVPRNSLDAHPAMSGALSLSTSDLILLKVHNFL